MKTTRSSPQAKVLADHEIAELQERVQAALEPDIGFVIGIAVPAADGQVYMRFETNVAHKTAFEILAAGGDAILATDNRMKGNS